MRYMEASDMERPNERIEDEDEQKAYGKRKDQQVLNVMRETETLGRGSSARES